MHDADEESDVLAALGSLANAAGAEQRYERRLAVGVGSASALQKQRTSQGQEVLQKWVQCARCNRWRKVPFTLMDENIPDHWTCSDNQWDDSHNNCTVPQALSDAEIDEILLAQDTEQDARAQAFAAAAAAEARVTSGGRGSGPNAAVHNAYGSLLRPSSSNTRGGSASGRGGVRGGSGGGRRGGRIGRGLSEAAAALLDMGFVDDDGDMDRAAEQKAGEIPVAAASIPFPPGAFRPRQVVWAKVEGHDWWPARVVRRRAVPREVGPPPGALQLVRHHIPVVFFTRRGIPGEVDEGMDSLSGAMAACMRALKASGHGEDGGADDEAEFAWLPVNALKTFAEGKLDGIADVAAAKEATLRECIAAAEAAEAAHVTSFPEDTDSDGGWGPPPEAPEPPVVMARGRIAGRGRGGGGRGRGGRGGRGNSRGRGRGRGGARGSRSGSRDDFDTDTDMDADAEDAQAAAQLPQILVDAILGWRWPLSEQQKLAEKEKSAQFALDSRKRLQAMRVAAGTANAPLLLAAAASDSPEQLALLAAASPSRVADLYSSLGDGSTALAAAPSSHTGGGRGATRSNVFCGEAAGGTALVSAASGESEGKPFAIPTDGGRPAEYLVKWVGKAHVHNEWVLRELLMRIAKRKLLNFERRCRDGPVDEVDPMWQVPQRFVARQPSPTGPGWEALVKWTNLGYDHCTWEVEGEGVLVMPQYLALHKALWERQQSASRRARPDLLAIAEATRQAAASVGLPSIDRQPEWVRGGPLLRPHQLEELNWLRSRWAAGDPCVMAEDIGRGKTATVIVFLQSLRHEMEAVRPILVVVPATMLQFWESETAMWVGDDANVIVYAGSLAARTVMHDQELWLSPASLDGKSATHMTRQALPQRVPKPDIVITSYEAAASDAAALKTISWEAAVLDERQRGRTGIAKAQSALSGIQAAFKILIPGTRAQASSNDTAALEFLQPNISSLGTLLHPLSKDPAQAAAQIARRRAVIADLSLLRKQKHIGPLIPAIVEVLLPAAPVDFQVATYCTVLSRHFDQLADPKAPRPAGQRASQLRGIVAELRKVCSHPALLPEYASAADEDTPGERIPAGIASVKGASTPASKQSSGKLRLLMQLLPALHASGHRILVLSQSQKALDTIQDALTADHGAESFERIDNSTPSMQRHATIQRFGQAGTSSWVFLHAAASCGLGTDLPDIGAVVIHDSAWDPSEDLQAISHAYRVGTGSKLVVYRLYLRDSVDERLLQLAAERRRSLRPLIRSPGRSSPEGTRLLEDVARWGAERMFSAAADADHMAASDPMASLPMSLDGTGRGSSSEQLTKDALSALVAITQSTRTHSSISPIKAEDVAVAAVNGNGHLSDPGKAQSLNAGPALEGASVREWQPGECRDFEDSGADGAVSAEDEDDEGEEADNGTLVRSESLASSAAFWDKLLRPRHQLLQKAEQEALEKHLAEQQRRHLAADDDADGSGALSAGRGPSDGEEESEDGQRPASPHAGTPSIRSDGDADYVERSQRGRGGRGRGGRGGGRGAGRGIISRRRRADDEEFNAAGEDGRGKRRRRAGSAAAADSSATAEAAVAAGESEARRQWARLDDVIKAIGDPGSQEGCIARRAFERLTHLTRELQLDSTVMELANQSAEVLLVMRPEGEAPSDFQEYTLVALLAVAATLSNTSADHNAILANLASQYKQDLEALKQVFDFIMQSLANFRSLYHKVSQLSKDGVHSSEGGRGSMGGGRSDLESFSADLDKIVGANYMQSAQAAGPLEVPLGPLQALSQFMPSETSPQLFITETETIIANLRHLQEQVALFDRMHSMRVKAIQEEYQRYMERVRTKAQTAIDQANTQYQHSRMMLTARVDSLVHYLQNRHAQVHREQQREQQQQQEWAQQQQQQQQQQPGQLPFPLGHQRAGDPGLADLMTTPAFARYMQNLQTNGMTADGLEALKQKFLEMQREEQQRQQDPGAHLGGSVPPPGSAPSQQGEGPHQQPPSTQEMPQLSDRQQQQKQQQPGAPREEAANSKAAPAGILPTAPHPQLCKVQAAAVGEAHSGGMGSVAAQSQGFMSQSEQQLLLARHLAQPLTLPLNRLTPKQSQQVMGQWHAQQPEQLPPVIHHARREVAPVVTTSAAGGKASPLPQVAAGSFAPCATRDAVSPSPTVQKLGPPTGSTMTRAGSGSMRGVTVQSGAPGLAGLVTGTNLDGAVFDGEALEISRQLSASRALSDATDMQRANSGSAPIVTSGGRSLGQSLSGDVGSGRPSISTGAGAPLLPRTPTRMAATPLAASDPSQQQQQQARGDQQPWQTHPSSQNLTQQKRQGESMVANPTCQVDRVRSFSTAATSGPVEPPPTAAAASPLPQAVSRHPAAAQQLTETSSSTGDPQGLAMGDNSEFADIIIQPSAFAAVVAPGRKASPTQTSPLGDAAVKPLPAHTNLTAPRVPGNALRRADDSAAMARGVLLNPSQQGQSDLMGVAERQPQSSPGEVPLASPGKILTRHEGSLRHWIDGQSAPP